MNPVSPPFVIRMFLPEGASEGIRIIERSNWVGQAVICPHGSFAKLKSRPEANRAGVYVLLGVTEDEMPKAYIGEADPIIERLVNHYKQKEWWDTAVFFVSKDQQLNKAHVQFLEARLVQLAKKANRCKLENGNVPAEPSLSEMEHAEMEGFLAHMLQIYPVAGVHLFQTPVAAQQGAVSYILAFRQGRAIGLESPEGFLVRAQSAAAKEVSRTLKPGAVKLREQLVELGVLSDAGDHFLFTQDYVFNSPSTAAKVVCGNEVNGRIAWKTEFGLVLRDVQNAAIEAS